jgi:mannose-6-phosphate isomerase class I
VIETTERPTILGSREPWKATAEQQMPLMMVAVTAFLALCAHLLISSRELEQALSKLNKY